DGYPVIAKALDYLCQLDEKLMECKVNSYVSYELGLISNYTYYTGIIFSGYAFGTGEPIAKGGRYDKLLSYFGKDAAAIGFAISVDDLMEALNSQAVDTKTSDGVRYLTIALGKGRLADKAMAYFEKIGLPCEEMKDKNTRKLIFVNEEKKVRFFLAKGPDVPTYVEYGAADIGIVGEDTILEEARNIFEVLDLGFGKCRMCVCGPQSAKPLLENQELIRVATKYPKIAKDYFYNKKHQTVEIIKLNGSIELAPIVGLSEVICDIVETGSTLRENGLVVLEEVCDLSARMVVNQVSMKMENERITEIIRALKKVTEE
ncbi:MAG: ATP phosphoribosyltransferase, partial [Lachnospiraceae bacterium]|nr:ATP phosphoribosyltransferase [Lachnospiraceae bacterium]